VAPTLELQSHEAGTLPVNSESPSLLQEVQEGDLTEPFPGKETKAQRGKREVLELGLEPGQSDICVLYSSALSPRISHLVPTLQMGKLGLRDGGLYSQEMVGMELVLSNHTPPRFTPPLPPDRALGTGDGNPKADMGLIVWVAVLAQCPRHVCQFLANKEVDCSPWPAI
jgi:hypothetical protein